MVWPVPTSIATWTFDLLLHLLHRLRLTKPCPAAGTWIFLGVYFKNDRPAMIAIIRQDPYNSGGDGSTIIRTIYKSSIIRQFVLSLCRFVFMMIAAWSSFDWVDQIESIGSEKTSWIFIVCHLPNTSYPDQASRVRGFFCDSEIIRYPHSLV